MFTHWVQGGNAQRSDRAPLAHRIAHPIPDREAGGFDSPEGHHAVTATRSVRRRIFLVMYVNIDIATASPSMQAEVQDTAERLHLCWTVAKQGLADVWGTHVEVQQMAELTNKVRRFHGHEPVGEGVFAEAFALMRDRNRGAQVARWCAEIAHGWRDEDGRVLFDT